MKKCAWAILLSCCMQASHAYAQEFPNINFSQLSTANGLPTNLITSVFKDSRGLIWMGSENDGLLRYDGKEIKSYRQSAYPNGIASGYAGVICEDKKGCLWISTLDGLYRLNPVTEQIKTYQHNDKDKNSLGTNLKPLPFTDSKGRLWVAGINGLQQYNEATDNFISYAMPPIPNPLWQDLAKYTGKLYEDSKGQIWVTSPYGLYLVNTAKKKLVPYFTGLYMAATDIFEDSQKQLWVSFWGGGLKKFNQQNGVYTDVVNNKKNIVQCLGEWEDNNKKKWLYFYNNNVFTLLDFITYKTKAYPPNPNIINSIQGNSVSQILNDKNQNIWICTDAGINIINSKKQVFTNYRLPIYQNQKENNSQIPKALLTEPNGYILSTWYLGRVYHFDKQWNLKKLTDKIPPYSSSAYSRAIFTIQKDDENNYWYGTDSGLVKQTGNSYKIYLPKDKITSMETPYAARNLLRRSDGLYWCRFSNRGVYIFDKKNGAFYKNYRTQYQGTASTMEYDKNGKLWLGTDKGLYYYQPAADSFIRFIISHPVETNTAYYNDVFQIYFDKENTGWIGTAYGLVKIPATTAKLEFITDANNPRKYPAFRLLKDEAGILWILSGTEIIAYNTANKKFNYYNADSGLPYFFQGFNGVFNWVNDSLIAAGSRGTITTFNPYKLLPTQTSTGILVTDITVDDKRMILDQHNTITAPPKTEIIKIHFALPDYQDPKQNRMYYQLYKNESSSWEESKDGNITFAGLSAGTYVLNLKGTSNNSSTDYATAQVIIIVRPYWYQTLLFRLSALAALSFFIYFFIKRRIRSVKNTAAIKQQITETEMAALKAQMNPHFMFNCINSIDAFIHTNDKYNATLYLNKFARLLRNILDSSKQNTVSFTKDVETLRLYIELEELRHENKFTTAITVDEMLLNNDYKVPPLIIQPFVENAILHGLKNREDNEGMLQITIKKTPDKILYSIKDNGIGRKAAGTIMQNKESSYGMQMSYDRIKLFNKEEKPSVEIIDLNKGNVAVGTEVKVFLNIV